MKLKKFAPYIFILCAIVAIFSFLDVRQVEAAGTCTLISGEGTVTATDDTDCRNKGGTWAAGVNSDEPAIEEYSGSCLALLKGDFDSCLIKIAYVVFNTIPAFLLTLVAQLFNIALSVSLSGKMYKDSVFIPEAWRVIRDFSNIFFILILLYIAIKMILGLTGHGTKKMIGSVIIMALLINFSMFAAGIVIDTSNILALIFYNKIDVETKEVVNGVAEERGYIAAIDPAKTGVAEKDISGGLVSKFNVAHMLSADFFEQAKQRSIAIPHGGLLTAAAYIGGGATVGSVVPIIGTGAGAIIGTVGYFLKLGSNEVPFTLLISIIVTSGLIMYFAVYALFISALSFIGRLIELWILLIFSPFAFMSFAVPQLSSVGTIGWHDWSKRLLTSSFMAPIFMAMLYILFLIMQTDIFGDLAQRNSSEQLTMETIVLIVLSALTVLIVLLKATSFAKKGAGQFGELAIGAGKAALGLAVSVPLLSAATIGRGTVKETAKYVQNDNSRKKDFDIRGRLKDTFKTPWSFANPGNYIKTLGIASKFATSGVAQGIHSIPGFKNSQGNPISLGEKMQDAEKEYERGDKSTSTLDAAAAHELGGKHGYPKDVKYGDLKHDEQEEVREHVDKDFLSKKAFGTTYENIRDAQQKAAIDDAAHRLHANRPAYTQTDGTIKIDVDVVVRDPQNPNSFINQPKTIKGLAGEENAKYYKKKPATGEALSAARKGSYDPRGIDLGAVLKSNQAPIMKLGLGLTAAVAAGIRFGFKTAGVNTGKVNKDFLKDIGEVVTDALKSVKINVDLSHVGEVKKGDDHGHGGGGGHH